MKKILGIFLLFLAVASFGIGPVFALTQFYLPAPPKKVEPPAAKQTPTQKSGVVQESSPTQKSGPLSKLRRGVRNIVTGPLEVQNHMLREAGKANPDWLAPVYGGLYGSMKGAGVGAGRMISGFVDFLTFPVDLPTKWRSLIPIERFNFDAPESLETP
ncbi:MAG: hypothetical protein HY582_00470 [Candidatus Omnitrophica bacterium]|nr:hypothetical protein [Candidatus Omnitrophota bacterium]